VRFETDFETETLEVPVTAEAPAAEFAYPEQFWWLAVS
jgi:hypothetical protein